MYDTPLTIEHLLAHLTESPQHVAALTGELSETELHTAPSEGEWSANDVLAHLRACADVWSNTIAVILREDSPTLRAISPRSWIRKTDYREIEFHPSFRAYQTQRADLLAVLESLPPESWSREATVTGVGKVFTRTVYTYAQWLANHERSHLRQMERIVNAIHV
jgi:hypothetical protein